MRVNTHAALYISLVLSIAVTTTALGDERRSAPLLISYAYFEKDDIQIENFKYFLATGTFALPRQTIHWCFVISTPQCRPCHALKAQIGRASPGLPDIGVASVYASDSMTLLYRLENVGMDVAAHNITLEYMKAKAALWTYRFFFFLNSSVKGPFFPSYMPARWHWTHAFLERLTGNVHAVSSSLVCLPVADEGGPGPRMESWAFLVDKPGLEAIMASPALHVRECKLCSNASGIVVSGEYGITASLLRAHYNVATLMAKYKEVRIAFSGGGPVLRDFKEASPLQTHDIFATRMARYKEGIDWRDARHWGCNDNVHPSRHGTYDGIAFHPFETVFIKSTWHVADPYTQRYAAWRLAHMKGFGGTDGRFNQRMYLYGVSLEAQDPNRLASGYNVTSYRHFFQPGGKGDGEVAWANKEWMRKHNTTSVPWQ